MSTAKVNITKLPEMCFSVDNVNGDIIVIKPGSMGYFKYDQQYALGIAARDGIEENDDIGSSYRRDLDFKIRLADHMNQNILEVTKAQSEAMSVGSMFGWDSRGADPDFYNEDGSRKS
jgi:hypothetical protein